MRQARHEKDPLVEGVSYSKPQLVQRKKFVGCCVILSLIVLGVLVIGLGVGLGTSYGTRSSTLAKSISISNLMGHLQELEDLAQREENSGSRAVEYGYNDSAEMVFEKLETAGFKVERQYFQVPIFEDAGNSTFGVNVQGIDYTFNFLQSSEFAVMRYSAPGVISDVELVSVPDGCDADDYTEGAVALVNFTFTGNCTLFDKAKSAESAGAAAIIMMRDADSANLGPPASRVYGETDDGYTDLVSIPVLGATYALGEKLLDFLDLAEEQGGTVQAVIETYTSVTMYHTYNVLAFSEEGDKDTLIVMGTHLDSVAAGPGINDNGSGSAANLEIALQFIKRISPVNQVLFAFWGAEELGLLGSRYYVKELDEEGVNALALNLNFDMIGSPNYVRQVYNGSGAENELVRNESATIQCLFEKRFKSEGLSYEITPFTGRSDYGPFIEPGVDVPAGGLATGADETKSPEERLTYGGIANAILDPCYHQSCDTTDNIDQDVYLEMASAAAYVLQELATRDNLREFLQDSDGGCN